MRGRRVHRAEQPPGRLLDDLDRARRPTPRRSVSSGRAGRGGSSTSRTAGGAAARGRHRSSASRAGRRARTAARSASVSGSSAAAAHRCGASTYGLAGSSTVASTGLPRILAGGGPGRCRAGRRGRSAPPARCCPAARPGPPAATARPGCRGSRRSAPRPGPVMSTPSSSALVVASPSSSTAAQRRFQGPPLLGQVAGPVGGHPLGEARRARLGEQPLGVPGPRVRRRAGTARRPACATPSTTRSASSSAASAVAARRTGRAVLAARPRSAAAPTARTTPRPRGEASVGRPPHAAGR